LQIVIDGMKKSVKKMGGPTAIFAKTGGELADKVHEACFAVLIHFAGLETCLRNYIEYVETAKIEKANDIMKDHQLSLLWKHATQMRRWLQSEKQAYAEELNDDEDGVDVRISETIKNIKEKASLMIRFKAKIEQNNQKVIEREAAQVSFGIGLRRMS
jgi:hypothetical protein